MLILRRFNNEDKDTLVKIMIEAFDNDSKIHVNSTGGPKGYNDGTFIEKWFKHEEATALVIVYNDKIIGGVNLWINYDTNINTLGCIFIDPFYENQGIGTKIWEMIEINYPDTKVWRTETPIFSKRNHHFYTDKCGFKVDWIENPNDSLEGSYHFKKVMR